MDKLVRAFGLHAPLRERIATGMPAYGSCAGMIMLADRIADARPDQQTLGGLDITVRRNAFGRQVDSFEEDLHIRELGGEPVRAVFIRAPWVEEAGGACEVLARVEAGPAAGRIVAARQGDLLATSFHPEVTGDHRVHRLFVDIVRQHQRERSCPATPSGRPPSTRRRRSTPSAGKLFAKLIKNIEVAARTGGGDPAGNPTLYDAIQKAKKTSVPNNNIDRAVKRGSGAEAGGARLGDDHLRGLRARRGRGPHRVPHRQPQPRRGRGAHGPDPQRRVAGRPGLGVVPLHPQGRGRRPQGPSDRSEDDILEVVLDAGAEEVNDKGDTFEVVCEATDVVAVRTALQDAGIDYDSAEASWVPSLQVPARPRRRQEDDPRHRGPRGLRRRPGRLRQRRHPGRRAGRARRARSDATWRACCSAAAAERV